MKTPLHSFHEDAGARIVPFAGWEMPVQFQGIIAEHNAVRKQAGVFDISHMGQVWVAGPKADEFLQNLVSNDVSELAVGKGLYALMCREDGGVIDDLYVYRLERDRFFVVINASRVETDIPWMKSHCSAGVEISEQIQRAAIALQGPRSEEILRDSFPDVTALPRNGVAEMTTDDLDFVVSRTGYTGEDGFEIFGPAGHVVPLYSHLLKSGEGLGLVPCGLGARDTLRLEMGYRLYGQDLDEQHSALESGLGWAIKLEKPQFIGKTALASAKAAGPRRRFVALRLTERGIPRHGHDILQGTEKIGEVTSGTFSPSLQIGIALGYVDNYLFPRERESERTVSIRIHERPVSAEIVSLPFYKRLTPHKN